MIAIFNAITRNILFYRKFEVQINKTALHRNLMSMRQSLNVLMKFVTRTEFQVLSNFFFIIQNKSVFVTNLFHILSN